MIMSMGSLAQILAGQYEFWDYYGSYLYDYSGNSRHAEITNSAIAPVLTDRGLYISDGYSLKMPKNAYKDFPITCTDMVVSVLFYPQTDKRFCFIKLTKLAQSFQVCFESAGGKVKISIEGNWSYAVTTTKNFNVWRLYTVRFSEVTSNTFSYVYLDGDDINTALTFMISSFNFATVDTRWEIGSSSIEGFLYQIWWHCQVSISINTLSSSMFNSASNPCTTLYAITPFKKCLSNQLDKFKNSENEGCASCIDLYQSCDKDQLCIDSCQYKCLSPSACRGVSYPICSPPSYCTAIPNTDICIKCNIGWFMSTSTPGVCEITVPGCKTFNNIAQCLECLPGYYRSITLPSVCIQCPDDCELCYLNYSGMVGCTKCPSEKLIHTSPLCVSICPPAFYINPLISSIRCSSCPLNCKFCTYNATLKFPICSECNDGFYLQNTHLIHPFQCDNKCTLGYYPDLENPPILCKSCISGCQVCSNNISCDQCFPGNMLSTDFKSCILCVYKCRICLSLTQCSQCADYYYLDAATQKCFLCSDFCKTCSSSIHCDECDIGAEVVFIKGLKSCRMSCFRAQFISGSHKSCAEYSVDKLKATLCLEASNGIVTCNNCLTSELNEDNCPATICPNKCRKCNTIDGTIKCLSCLSNNYIQPDGYSCESTCPDYYNKNVAIGACSNCISNCKKCSNNSSCEECGNEYSISPNSLSCLLNCPVKFYSDRSGIWICRSCLNNCDLCSSSTNCLGCAYNMFLITSSIGVISCESACPPRHYFDNNRFCYKCMDNCDVCAVNSSGVVICSTCSIGYIMINGECLELICDPNCINCVISSIVLRCDLCKNGYFIDPYSYKCLTVCSSRYYADTGTKRCESCMPNCDSCIEAIMSKPTCNLCSPNYIFNSSTGVNLCEYTKCPVSCTDCTITSPGIICNTCNLGYFMQPTAPKCEITCTRGHYGDINDNRCKICSNNCEECNMNGCISCAINYYIQPNLSCDTSCPDRYYKDDLDRTCKECSIDRCFRCELVDSRVLCIECYNPYYLRIDSTCDTICEDGYYPDNISKKCTSCPIENCSNCHLQQDSSFICTECMVNYYLYSLEDSRSCVSKCPIGYYEDNSNICSNCKENCIKCTNSDDCLKCQQGYYLQPDIDECKSYCPEFYYTNDSLEAPRCSFCKENCRKCLDNKNCMECDQGFYIQPFGNKVCDIICPVEYYKSEITPASCNPCKDGCFECDENKCQKCKEGYESHNDQNEPCRITCPEYYFENVLNGIKICSECSIGCLSCYSENLCNECDLGFNLINNSCIECDYENCFHCGTENNELVCVECIEGFYVIDNMNLCVSICPEGFFTNNNLSCSKCLDNCKECSNRYECEECLTGYYYDNVVKGCLIIPINKCNEGSSLNGEFVCTKCANDYYRIDSDIEPCVPECPESYYPDYTNDIISCIQCISDCKSCSSYEICDKCKDGTSNKETCSSYTAEEIAQAQAVSETTSNLSTASTATSISAASVNYNLQNAWSIMNTVQIFSYVSLIQVNMPKMLKDTINSKDDTKYIPNIYKEEFKGNTKPQNETQKERFETTSFLWNCRKQTVQIYAILVTHLLVKLISLVLKGKIKAVSDKVLKMFFWKIYGRFFILVYFDILNAAFLQLLYVRNI
jgi:hypothetical protein